jgi:hypothetical protein
MRNTGHKHQSTGIKATGAHVSNPSRLSARKDTRQPRKPSRVELQQLAQFIGQRFGFADDPVENEKEAAWLVEMAYIAVFDDYVTGCPGYAGTVMTVVWDGSPTQYEVYIWSNSGEIAKVRTELNKPYE